MKNVKNILIGVLLISIGLIFALNTLGITSIDIFFDGWWTLFIIVPCICGFFSDHDKVGPAIGLVIGVVLLLWEQEIIDITKLLKLIWPAALVLVGIKIIASTLFKKKDNESFPKNRPTPSSYSAVFSGQDLKFEGQVFEGASLTAAFGGIDCDLRNAIIEKDVFINASAAFGGIDIFLPDDLNLRVKSSAIFGSVEYKKNRKRIEGAHTVYVNADVAFGGIEIK